MWHRVGLVRTNVSEERVASVFRVPTAAHPSHRRENLKSYTKERVVRFISWVVMRRYWNTCTKRNGNLSLLKEFYFVPGILN
jgi:hypothetical protein